MLDRVRRFGLPLLVAGLVLIAVAAAGQGIPAVVAPEPAAVTVTAAPPPTYGKQALDAVMPLALAALTALATILANAIMAKLKIDRESALGQKIQAAAARGAGLGYSVMAEEASHLADMPIKNLAVSKGVAYVQTMLPDTIKALDLTPDKVQAMVEAELGKLLAVDPNVAIGPTPTAAAPAPAPAAAAAA